jgi:hypothetical protein
MPIHLVVMKSPQTQLTELMKGRINCFLHERPESTKEFAKCCKAFVESEWNIARCCILVLKGHIPEDRRKALEAITEIWASNIYGIMIDHGFRAMDKVMNQLGKFLDPKYMVRFENMDEAKEDMPPLKHVDVAVPDTAIRDVEKLYDRCSINRVTVSRVKTRTGGVRIMLEDGEPFKATKKDFDAYIRKISGNRRLRNIEVQKNGDILAELGKQQKVMVKLGSLVSCSIQRL